MDVVVYGPLRSATGSKTVALSPDEATVAGVVAALRETYPRVESHLVDEEGSLRPSVRVTVDGEAADPEDAVPPDAEIGVFPAMRGG
ncbi:MAG: ubiquitin-like small modifier protein 1 [Haloferacaceae archaeon]